MKSDIGLNIEFVREISYHQRVKLEIKLLKGLSPQDYKLVQAILKNLEDIANHYLDPETKTNED